MLVFVNWKYKWQEASWVKGIFLFRLYIKMLGVPGWCGPTDEAHSKVWKQCWESRIFFRGSLHSTEWTPGHTELNPNWYCWGKDSVQPLQIVPLQIIEECHYWKQYLYLCLMATLQGLHFWHRIWSFHCSGERPSKSWQWYSWVYPTGREDATQGRMLA